MVVTIDGVWIDNWIYWVIHSYTQLQCNHYSRPSHKATLHSLQWQRLLSLCSTALSRLTPNCCNCKLKEGEAPHPTSYRGCSHAKEEMERRKNFRQSTHSPNVAWGRIPKKTLPHCCAGPHPVENSSFHCCVRVRCHVTSFCCLLTHSVHVTIYIVYYVPYFLPFSNFVLFFHFPISYDF
jgi:hypothetical protein